MFGEAGGVAPIDDGDAADRPRGEEEGTVVGISCRASPEADDGTAIRIASALEFEFLKFGKSKLEFVQNDAIARIDALVAIVVHRWR